jgi:hypothetical protein
LLFLDLEVLVLLWIPGLETLGLLYAFVVVVVADFAIVYYLNDSNAFTASSGEVLYPL